MPAERILFFDYIVTRVIEFCVLSKRIGSKVSATNFGNHDSMRDILCVCRQITRGWLDAETGFVLFLGKFEKISTLFWWTNRPFQEGAPYYRSTARTMQLIVNSDLQATLVRKHMQKKEMVNGPSNLCFMRAAVKELREWPIYKTAGCTLPCLAKIAERTHHTKNSATHLNLRASIPQP